MRAGPILAAALALGTSDVRGDERGGAERLVGRSAPAITATDVAGDRPVSLGDLRGRVAVLYFFNTWCKVCADGSDFLARLKRDLPGSSLAVLGISREPIARLGRETEARPVPHTVARDDGGTFHRYGVTLLPTFVVLDRSGVVRTVVVGAGAARFRRVETAVRRLVSMRAAHRAAPLSARFFAAGAGMAVATF